MTSVKAIEVAIEIEEALKVAKDTVYDTNLSTSVQIVNSGEKKHERRNPPRIRNHNSTQKTHHRNSRMEESLYMTSDHQQTRSTAYHHSSKTLESMVVLSPWS